MKSPLCDICLNSGILCSSCEKKIGSGLLSRGDFEALKIIRQKENEIKGLKDVEIKRIINEDETLVLVCSRGDVPKLVGKGGSVVKDLGKKVGKHVKVVEESENKRDFLQGLIFPVPILNLNVVYGQAGEKYLIKIPGGSRLNIPRQSFLKIAKRVLGKEVEIGYDQEIKKESIEEKIKRALKKMESANASKG